MMVINRCMNMNIAMPLRMMITMSSVWQRRCLTVTAAAAYRQMHTTTSMHHNHHIYRHQHTYARPSLSSYSSSGGLPHWAWCGVAAAASTAARLYLRPMSYAWQGMGFSHSYHTITARSQYAEWNSTAQREG